MRSQEELMRSVRPELWVHPDAIEVVTTEAGLLGSGAYGQVHVSLQLLCVLGCLQRGCSLRTHVSRFACLRSKGLNSMQTIPSLAWSDHRQQDPLLIMSPLRACLDTFRLQRSCRFGWRNSCAHARVRSHAPVEVNASACQSAHAAQGCGSQTR